MRTCFFCPEGAQRGPTKASSQKTPPPPEDDPPAPRQESCLNGGLNIRSSCQTLDFVRSFPYTVSARREITIDSIIILITHYDCDCDCDYDYYSYQYYDYQYQC